MCVTGSIHFHLRFKQAQPKMWPSRKVDDGVENKLFPPWTHTFEQFSFEEL